MGLISSIRDGITRVARGVARVARGACAVVGMVFHAAAELVRGAVRVVRRTVQGIRTVLGSPVGRIAVVVGGLAATLIAAAALQGTMLAGGALAGAGAVVGRWTVPTIAKAIVLTVRAMAVSGAGMGVWVPSAGCTLFTPGEIASPFIPAR